MAISMVNNNLDYRTRVDDSHNPNGPDGRGWNRMAIIGLGSHDRCTLIPITRQGALDTLRGMAKHGNPFAYSDCVSNTPCHQCKVATRLKDTWRNEWHIREDSSGMVWLLGNVEKGFACNGYPYKNWASLLSEEDVPMLARMSDSQGFYWIAA